MTTQYNPDCKLCPRLTTFLRGVKADYPSYFCKPVPPFGVVKPKLLIVGLAPGMHGANATGRPFTGDHAGILLYETLHHFGFASKAASLSADDNLKLINCRITNAVKCLPPQNKPDTAEIKTCNGFLRAELAALPNKTVLLALGGIAHNAVLTALGFKVAQAKFAHAAKHDLPSGHVLFDSYHCSRYNTNTRRLTTETFRDVFAAIKAHLQ